MGQHLGPMSDQNVNKVAQGRNALCKEMIWWAMGTKPWLGWHQEGDLDTRYMGT